MKLAQQTQYKMPPQSVIDDLLARGVSSEDIHIGITMQERQRGAGAPVLPLAVLVGLEQPNREPQSVLNRVARTILRVKPPARRKAVYFSSCLGCVSRFLKCRGRGQGLQKLIKIRSTVSCSDKISWMYSFALPPSYYMWPAVRQPLFCPKSTTKSCTRILWQ